MTRYLLGFGLSLLLTLIAYVFVMSQPAFSTPLGGFLTPLTIGILVALAIVQFFVQIICFLHLGTDTLSREKILMLAGTFIVVVILVGGSLWIMSNLNQRMMPSSAQMMEYMGRQKGI